MTKSAPVFLAPGQRASCSAYEQAPARCHGRRPGTGRGDALCIGGCATTRPRSVYADRRAADFLEQAIEVNQAVLFFADLNIIELNEHDGMRTDFLAFFDMALQLDQRIVQHRLESHSCTPGIDGESLLHGNFGCARKVPRQFFVLTGQNIDAQMTVFLKDVMHGAVAIDAYQNGWRRIGNGTHGTGRDAAAPSVSIRADNGNRGGQMGHGVAKRNLCMAQSLTRLRRGRGRDSSHGSPRQLQPWRLAGLLPEYENLSNRTIRSNGKRIGGLVSV
jgi:hypothetical protein